MDRRSDDRRDNANIHGWPARQGNVHGAVMRLFDAAMTRWNGVTDAIGR